MSENVARTYGNFRRPTSPGVLGLSFIGTILMFAGAIVLALLAIFGQWILLLVWAVLLLLTLAAMAVKDQHKRTLAVRIATRIGWRRTRRLGANVYRSGPQGRTTYGTFQLPGLLASTILHEARDSYGRPFALLEMPAVGHFSVTFSVTPEGASLVDQDQVDQWVAGWGHWLANLGQELGLVAAQVTIETAPDSGARLRREVTSRIDDDAPELAKQMLTQVMADYPSGSSADRAWVSLTFRAHTVTGKRRSADEMARDIGTRVPGLTESLSGSTGAAAAMPLTAAQLCEVVRIAYDPQAATIIDAAHDEGEPPEVSWADVGPVASEASWTSYRHDGALSRSWYMSSAPRGEVYANVLARLLSPHPDIDRKRVSVIYRPVSAARAAYVVERDKRTSDVRMTATNRPSARTVMERQAAYSTAQEEARGAGLVDFAMIVTATVVDPERMADAHVAIEGLSATARVLLRPAWGSQDSAFAAGLPLGMVLQAHSRVPDQLREQM